MRSTVYDHNFLVLDGRAPGPDFVIGAPFALQTARPLDPAFAALDGQRFRYVKGLADKDRVSAALQGFGSAAGDYAFTIENAAAGAGMKITGDRPLSSLSLWSIRSVLALEPFIAISIDPGRDFTWHVHVRLLRDRQVEDWSRFQIGVGSLIRNRFQMIDR